MSFDALENSRALGAPATLYLFTYGSSSPAETYAYTDASESITYDGVTYTPAPIWHGKINQSGTLDRATLEVRTAKDSDVAELFQIYPPSRVVTLEIRQGHIGDSPAEYLVRWSGRVLSVGREDHDAVLNCEPISTSMRRNGLRRFYNYGCPHELYGTQCGATPLTVAATVTVVNDNVIYAGPSWRGAYEARVFRNGYVEWTTAGGVREIRTILRINGSEGIVCKGVVTNLSASDAITVTVSCNHKMDDCADLHNNINNFGGQPFIPTKNPLRAVNNHG